MVAAMNDGLFPEPTQIPIQRQAPQAERAITNDMDLIESVIRAASDPGYFVIGPTDKVYRRDATRRDGIERVPRYEEDTVHQLIQQKLFRIGGSHEVTYGPYSGRANSILVNKKTVAMARRWRSYKRPESWGARRYIDSPASR